MSWTIALIGVWGWAAALVWLWRSIRGSLAYSRAPRVPTRAAAAGACVPPASILVPARNEESNIRECLERLARQEYPDFEVIAIDDNSTDGTWNLIQEAARENQRIVPLRAPPTPEGWTGKNRALAAGAGRARGEWLLFTDADARFDARALSSAVLHARERGLDLLTLLPRAITGSLFEAIFQPPAMGYLGWWFPFERVNRPGDPAAFGNGQFLLLRREAYEALGGHEAVREAFLEDIALFRAAKLEGLKAECALGKRLFGVRMYDSPQPWWRGWHRIYLHAFGRRWRTLFGKAAEVFALAAAPPALFLFLFLLLLLGAAPGDGSPGGIRTAALAGTGAATVLSILFAAKMGSAVGKRSPLCLLHPLAAAAIAAVLLSAARAAFTGAPTKWR